MGWFSRSTATPSESSQKRGASGAGSSLAQEGSPAEPTATSSEAAAAAVKEPRIDTGTAQQTYMPSTGEPAPGSSASNTNTTTAADPSFLSLPALTEIMQFDEYKASDDIFARFKASDALNGLISCSSLGSNIRNYYRYGTYRNCTDKYDHLKFCLSIKTKSSEVAQVMIQRRDAELRAKKKNQPNSEDVWTARTHPPEELVDLARQA
ncbi:hypothetical protein BGZ65_002543 [Modicella reniformis]|uniref:Uncharacterized protein n=1 Tax=Modicella reniformis TaxID=1440133 RepID=A0A9P6SNJ9_9FUNG|nr:hypothetical protein BGZ65_002543 [Modicella reniformis]